MIAAEIALTVKMQPLMDRGRIALRVYTEGRHFDDERHRAIVLGTAKGMHVVTRADFVANVDLCLDYVELNGMPTHILCESGPICLALEKRETDW